MKKYINLKYFYNYIRTQYTQTTQNLNFYPKGINKVLITTKRKGKNNLPSQMFIINRTSKNVYKIIYLDSESAFFCKCQKAKTVAEYIQSKYLIGLQEFEE